MEFVNAIVAIIQSVGFPIVCCGALFWKINEQDKQHKEEMDKLADVVNQNTVAIYKLTVHLEGGKDDE